MTDNIGCVNCNVHHEDPLPWCDCRSDETCEGPCRQKAHDPKDCPWRRR